MLTWILEVWQLFHWKDFSVERDETGFLGCAVTDATDLCGDFSYLIT